MVASHMQGVWRALSSSTNEKRSCVRACLLSVWPCSVCSVTEHGGCGNLHPGLRGHLPCSTRHCSPRSGAGVMNSSAECKHRSRGSGALLRHTAVNAQTQQACVSALWVRPNTSVNARRNGGALARKAVCCIIGLAGQAPHRRSRLSSNVRPRLPPIWHSKGLSRSRSFATPDSVRLLSACTQSQHIQPVASPDRAACRNAPRAVAGLIRLWKES